MPRADADRGGAGFTLIEILVVLVILALVGGLVLARGPQRSPTLAMRQGAAAVAGTLRLARARAIAANRPVEVRFAPGAGTLQLGADPPRLLPPGVAVVVTGVADGPGSAILFRPDGSSSGGAVRLAVADRVDTVEVGWLTGRVSVSERVP